MSHRILATGIIGITLVLSFVAIASRRWNAQVASQDCRFYIADCSECPAQHVCIPPVGAPGYCYRPAGTPCASSGMPSGQCDGLGQCKAMCEPGTPECTHIAMLPEGSACDPSTTIACCSAGVPGSGVRNCAAGLSCVNGVCKKQAVCGDLVIDPGEDCDGGKNCCTNAVSGCIKQCSCPNNLVSNGMGGCKCPADKPYLDPPFSNNTGFLTCTTCPNTPPPPPPGNPLIAGDCYSKSGGAEVSTCCPQGYACKAYGSTPEWKCMRLIDTCDKTYSCSSYTDCAANYDENGKLLDDTDPDFVHCYDGVCADNCGNGGGTSGGYSGMGGAAAGGGNGGTNTGGAAGDTSGGTSGDGGNGGDTAGGSSSNGQSSSSSSKACNNNNPCIAATVVNSTIVYTVPPSCPLDGSKEACYTQCIDTINRTNQKIDCSAQCGISDADLNMCPCNPDNQQCVWGCMIGVSACISGCGADQSCKSQCSTQYRSCLDGCGRACPASSSGSSGSSVSSRSNSSSRSSNSSRSGTSSSRSASSTSNGSNGSNNSNGSNSSQSSQNSSGSNRSGSSSSASNKSNSNSSTSASSRSNSNSSISHNSSNNSSASNSNSSTSNSNSSTSNNSSNNSNSSRTSSRSSSISNTSSSSRSNVSQSSSTSSLTNGVCCEAGNCNPFGSCSNPFVNYAACKAVCGTSSMSSRISSSSSSSSSSRSSLSSFSSSSTSSSRSSSSSTSQSSSQSSASSRSQYSDASSQLSYGPPCTDASQCASGLCQNGICVDVNSSRIAVVPRSRSSASTVACFIDGDCPTGTRCILSRCLTVTEIAQLPPFCGNARPDAGEQCDLGAENSDRPNAYCRPDCTLGRCGDGIIDTPLELCDDGNVLNNDGCSAACLVERAAPPTTLPATTIELPFVNKGHVGSNTDNRGSDVGGISTESDQPGVPSSVPSTPDTGPAALAIMIAGGAAGWLYRRRK